MLLESGSTSSPPSTPLERPRWRPNSASPPWPPAYQLRSSCLDLLSSCHLRPPLGRLRKVASHDHRPRRRSTLSDRMCSGEWTRQHSCPPLPQRLFWRGGLQLDRTVSDLWDSDNQGWGSTPLHSLPKPVRQLAPSLAPLLFKMRAGGGHLGVSGIVLAFLTALFCLTVPETRAGRPAQQEGEKAAQVPERAALLRKP